MPGGALLLFAGVRILETSTKITQQIERILISLLGTSLIFVGALSIAFNYFIIIVLIIVLALIVFYAVKSTADKKRLYSVVVVVLISAGMVSLIVNNLQHPTSPLTPTPTETLTPEIKITYPLDGAHVDVQENMYGTAKNIPKGDDIWIFVHPHTVNKYYPQRSNAVIQNEEWSLSSVLIGTENDTNQKYDIIAVLADKKAQEEINSYFAECEKTGKWLGMDKIPDNAKEYHRITVVGENKDTEILITYPLNASKVKIQENIQGTAKSIPEGQTAWLIIYPHTAYKYYPQNKLDIRDEKWSYPAQFGGEEHVGDKFDIIVVLADQKAHEELANYLETCIKTNTWPGTMTLPVGVKEYARVTVTRE